MVIHVKNKHMSLKTLIPRLAKWSMERTAKCLLYYLVLVMNECTKFLSDSTYGS